MGTFIINGILWVLKRCWGGILEGAKKVSLTKFIDGFNVAKLDKVFKITFIVIIVILTVRFINPFFDRFFPKKAQTSTATTTISNAPEKLSCRIFAPGAQTDAIRINYAPETTTTTNQTVTPAPKEIEINYFIPEQFITIQGGYRSGSSMSDIGSYRPELGVYAGFMWRFDLLGRERRR